MNTEGRSAADSRKKLSLGTLLSYGVGAVGEGIGYNVFFSFFSFFIFYYI